MDPNENSAEDLTMGKKHNPEENRNSNSPETGTKPKLLAGGDKPRSSPPKDIKMGRIRTRSEATSDNDENGNRDAADASKVEQNSETKRQRMKSGGPVGSAAFFMPAVAASPPKFVTFEQVMSAANGMQNMALAHEIALDDGFKVEKEEFPEDSPQHKIKEVIQRAFWDAFKAKLEANPPDYSHVLVLIGEIKEKLLALLLPHHTQIKTEINESLDCDLLKQQADNNVIEFPRLAQFVIALMARLCAPVRDRKIKELASLTDITDCFRNIMDTLDLMKLDMANFAIQQIRPHVKQYSIEYERKKFAECLQVQEDGLRFTKRWLSNTLQELRGSSEACDGISIAQVLNQAYLGLLDWTDSDINAYPETLLMDVQRFTDIRDRVVCMSLVAAVLLVTQNAAGPDLTSIQPFKKRILERVNLLLEADDCKTGGNVSEETFQGIALQVEREIAEFSEKHGVGKPLSVEGLAHLKTQIVEIGQPDNKIRQVVKRRILDFIELILTNQSSSPVKIPIGLSALQTELTRLAGEFVKLVSHNREVFCDYYKEIINTLIDTAKARVTNAS